MRNLEVKMKKQTFCFKQLLLIAFGVCSVSTFVYGSTQNVTVSGAVVAAREFWET